MKRFYARLSSLEKTGDIRERRKWIENRQVMVVEELMDMPIDRRG